MSEVVALCDTLDPDPSSTLGVQCAGARTVAELGSSGGSALVLTAADVVNSVNATLGILGLGQTPADIDAALGAILGFLDGAGLVELSANETALGLFGSNATFTVDNSTTITFPVAEINFDSAEASPHGNEITFYSVTVSVASVNTTEAPTVLDLGNVTLTAAQLQTLLTMLVGTDVETYKLKFVVPTDVTIAHNASSWHANFIFYGYARQEAYQDRCSIDGNDASVANRFVVRNHPLPLTTRQALEIRFILSIFASLFILIALCYAPAAFVTFVVKERSSKSKHLQLLSGARVHAYWLATYLFDSLLVVLLTLLLMALLACYGTKAAAVFLSPPEAALATALLLLLFGLSAIPFNYALSFLFDNHNSAQISLLVINFTTGFIATMAFVIMDSINSTKELAETLRLVFLCFPPYNLGEGLLRLSASFFSGTILGNDVNIFGWGVVGGPLVLMFVEAVAYLALTLMLETKLARRLSDALDHLRTARFLGALDRAAEPHGGGGGPEEDEDVAAEAERVAGMRLAPRRKLELAEGAPDGATVLLHGLHKVYPPPVGFSASVRKCPGGACARCGGCGGAALLPDGSNVCAAESGSSTWRASGHKHAVRGLSLAVPRGETFGFLGINGAGKTTTLSILTGDLTKSRGEALINGGDVGDGGTQRQVGYCPQEDPLLELMTGEESLLFFGRLKGLGGASDVREAALRREVASLLLRLGLHLFKDEPCGGYSGGMKRKLSFAMALIGKPAVLLLDEPSTGTHKHRNSVCRFFTRLLPL